MSQIEDGESQSVQVAGTSSHVTGKSFWILNTFKSSKNSSESLVAAPLNGKVKSAAA